ncbi:hypothetical protein COL24_00915 [Bacillus toyonensis]|uniref:hypothetical protein n=1 Tax=Bacillus cereus group TaxID=86661 RepID=UPI000BF175D4|nr:MULTISPECIES: hypothetical protein [Bacillus cereus group]PEO24940.1 hypothetical protein CN589_26130 [Bacillus toyonensis]PEP14041.1 hypothetical protein CN552_16305 [Bacillus wiedmannii]PFX45601.1 hypothetical protein COL24_00915 [Bacillus toyonensis]PFX97222.1 hypothetical protein COL45_28380 [Bacillus toyonensis]PHB76834.1 hypothetical protein COE93_16850 [Bacillus toyonensis]
MNKETLVVTDEILDRYKREMILKAKWTDDSIKEAYSAWDSIKAKELDGKNEEVIRKFVAGITNAVAIVRILNVPNNNQQQSEILATKRVKAIKNKWPNLPEAPQGLKQIRNALEHFEDRLDSWAFTSTSHSIVDLNLGVSKDAPQKLGDLFEVSKKEFFRNVDEEGNFLFWNHKVKISDISKWVNNIKEQLEK